MCQNAKRLKVAEIFTSIDGEVNGFSGSGQFSTFIRLAGCNLHCAYCDTPCARDGSTFVDMQIDEIVEGIEHPYKVTITGGEPMLQKESLYVLIHDLVINGYQVTLETNGSYIVKRHEIIIPELWDELRIVMDYKLPSSGVEHEMLYKEAFERLSPFDVIKFVINDSTDYDRALEIVDKFKSDAKKVFSPVYPSGQITPKELIDTMLKDKREGKLAWDVDFSVQVHKLLGVQ